MDRARGPLVAARRPEGFWAGEVTASYAPAAGYILLQWWLHPPRDGHWRPPRPDLVERAVRSILNRQCPDGGFPVCPGGDGELNETVRAYFALRAAGVPAEYEAVRAARRRILDFGGLPAASELTRITLGLFGVSRNEPNAPIPAGLLAAGGLAEPVGSWARAIAVSLAILGSRAAVRPAPTGFDADELSAGAARTAEHRGRSGGWPFDRLGKLGRRLSSNSRAARSAEAWLLEYTRTPDGLTRSNPAAMYVMMALDALGCPSGAPTRSELERRSHEMLPEVEPGFVEQRFSSPVDDTALAATALLEGGLACGADLESTVDWLVTQEVNHDASTAAMVLLAAVLAQAAGAGPWPEALRRGTQSLLGAQGRGGGWPALDAHLEGLLGWRPFPGRGALPEPASADVTGHVLEALCASGLSSDHPVVRRGVRFLIEKQEPEGSWPGPWGASRLYGTFRALRGLRAAGVDDREAYVLRSAEWIRSIQNADGGWGESDVAAEYVPAPSTPSQTAWAVLGLLAAGDCTSDSVERGVERLAATQQPDGNWRDSQPGLPGIPGAVWTASAVYGTCFPLLALAAYGKAAPPARRM